MALKDITASIISDAEKQAAEIVKAGLEEVKQINKEYQALAAEKKEEFLKRLERDQLRQVDQALFAQKIKAKNELLEEKKKLIGQIFDKALEKLQHLPEEDNIKILTKLLKELPQVEQGEIIPAKAAADQIAKALIKNKLNYKISSSQVTSKGGFKFTSTVVDVDNTYENLLAKSFSDMETKIAQILFEEKPA